MITCDDRGSGFITEVLTGIGYTLAQELDARGWRVVCRRPYRRGAQRLHAVLSARGLPVHLDVTNAAHIELARSSLNEPQPAPELAHARNGCA